MNLLEQPAIASAASPPKRVLGIDLGTTNSTMPHAQVPLDPAGSPELLCECISIEQMTPSGQFFGSLVPSVVPVVNEFFATALATKNHQTLFHNPDAITA